MRACAIYVYLRLAKMPRGGLGSRVEWALVSVSFVCCGFSSKEVMNMRGAGAVVIYLRLKPMACMQYLPRADGGIRQQESTELYIRTYFSPMLCRWN